MGPHRGLNLVNDGPRGLHTVDCGETGDRVVQVMVV